MPRPNRSDEKRAELLPLIARCFAERGFRRATTADLAAACGVQETILYRLWPGKKAMFLAAIEYVYEQSERVWEGVLGGGEASGSAAERLLAYEARHLGEYGLYRIYFAGLNETDDAEIRAALRTMFESFHRQIRTRIEQHRLEADGTAAAGAEAAAWALLGVGMIANLSRDLDLFDDAAREALISDVGRLLLEGAATTGGR